jgi:hypothetical protein
MKPVSRERTCLRQWPDEIENKLLTPLSKNKMPQPNVLLCGDECRDDVVATVDTEPISPSTSCNWFRGGWISTKISMKLEGRQIRNESISEKRYNQQLLCNEGERASLSRWKHSVPADSECRYCIQQHQSILWQGGRRKPPTTREERVNKGCWPCQKQTNRSGCATSTAAENCPENWFEAF